MNRKDVLQNILKLIGSFEVAAPFVSELIELLSHSGIENQFFKLLTARLYQLSQLGVNAPRLAEFEQINEQLWSMHFSGKGFNIRVLYSFLPNGEPVLLLAFYERSNKKKTNYSTYIPVAEERLKCAKEEYNNDHR